MRRAARWTPIALFCLLAGGCTGAPPQPPAPVAPGMPPVTDFHADCDRGLPDAAQHPQDCYWAAYPPLLAQHRARSGAGSQRETPVPSRQLNEELRRSVALIAEQRRDAAANLIQSSALVAETIGNYNIRLANLNAHLEAHETQRRAADVQFFTEAIANGNSAVQAALSIYLDNVASGAAYPEALFGEQFQRVQDELGGKPVLGRSLIARATLFMKHVEQYRQTRRLERERVLNEMLAPR